MARSGSTQTVKATGRIALVSSLAAWVFTPAVWAQTIPASVRACTLETDSLKRLVCFDKEVARYMGQPPATQGAAPSPPAPPNRSTDPPAVAAAPAPALPASAPPAPAAPAPDKPRHIAAHILSIEPFPDAMVVHLDNNQVWEQIQEAPADVNLHTGDPVTIDREMGSYWLSGKGAAMKVRQKK